MEILTKTIQPKSHSERIKKRALELGFLDCGIAKADFLEDEAPRLEAYLNENPQVLLAMAHYKRRFIESLLTKSISQEIAYHTKTPLLIFNA